MGDVIKESAFKWVVDFYRRLPIYGKIIFFVFLALLLFSLARNDIFGEHMQAISKRVIPTHLKWIDPPRPRIQLTLQIYVQSSEVGNQERVKLGERYPSDSEMILSYDVKQKCHILIIGVDSKKTYPIVYEGADNGNYSSTYFKPTGSPEQLPFKLDGTIGKEAYIAIASYEKFKFKDQIKTAVDQMLREESARGPEFKYFLDIDDDFYQRSVYFNSVDKK